MKKNILIITLLLSGFNLFSQNNELIFGRYSFMKSKGYKVKIKENQTDIIIELKLADSISTKLYSDKKYRKLSNKLKRIFNRNGSKIDLTDSEVLKSIALDFDNLYEKHTFYKTDVLILDKLIFAEYYNEFAKMINCPISILENKNDSRIVLNGYFLTFIKKTEKQDFILNLNSPNEESHPFLIHFLKETFKVFRNENKNNFVDEKYTFGL
jgi:hypothetical protein